MIVGIPKETKPFENRVGIAPAGVLELTKNGHEVIIETNAGFNSGYTDNTYTSNGATVVADARRVFESAELIVKVKEPLEAEYSLINSHHTIFTYFHFASSRQLTHAMVAAKAVCIAYETVTRKDGSLPLLIPMSEVAGRMAVQEGAVHLERHHQGKGILLGGVPGVRPAQVLVLGGGVVGMQAARMAAGLGAHVTIMDISLPRLRYLSETMPANVTLIMSNSYNIREALRNADLVIGAVLIPGAKAPVLVSRDMLALMQPGTVVIDVAVDQGGCIETCRPTTHEAPTYIIDGIIHYCVANMPGAVPYTSTVALTNATLPYIVELADNGWEKACNDNSELKSGLNIVSGQIRNSKVAAWYELE